MKRPNVKEDLARKWVLIETFKTYMEGAAMDIIPRLVFEDATKGDRTTYDPYTSYIGSFFCGGTVISAMETVMAAMVEYL